MKKVKSIKQALNHRPGHKGVSKQNDPYITSIDNLLHSEEASKTLKGTNNQPHSENILTTSEEEENHQKMSISNPPKNKWRVIAVLLWVTSWGMSDGAPGALLPHMESYYDINYIKVSLIWIFNAIGYFAYAAFAHDLKQIISPRAMYSVCSLLQLVMFSFIVPGSKFALVVAGFFFGGIGNAMGDSQQNLFLSRFDKSSLYLGYFHGGFGIGATVSPLIATAMVNAGCRWSFFFFILVGFSIFNFLNLWFSFEGCETDLKPWEKDDFDETFKEDPDISQISIPLNPLGQKVLFN
ncbi:unnamed protein product [Ambrosiozyma monospora]|uniref:Unnamed protein product n=1 Tax=Ambrosiozyma monospora TaxID=43982 RepID=A0ACB5SZS9_AMBMO|nr:unnamed protein product [Ambrosiozyma monospora]